MIVKVFAIRFTFVKILDFTPFFSDYPLHNSIEQCKLNDRN